MPQPRVLVLRAPGTNCDVETAYAFELAGGQAQRVHINALVEQPNQIDEFQILCLPGGFSYGDDLAAGRILGNQIRHRLADVLRRFKSADKLILGICNGFQVLLKTDVLLEPLADEQPAATLTYNDSGKFEDRWVRLASGGTNCVFFAGIEQMELPVAHAEGKFVAINDQVFEQLESGGQIVLRYASSNGGEVAYPQNPNGSRGHVAGLCDTTGRVCGLMPHPERHLDATHHPQWTRRDQQPPAGDGLLVFQNAVQYFN